MSALYTEFRSDPLLLFSELNCGKLISLFKKKKIVECTNETIWTWTFLLWKVSNYWLKVFNRFNSILIPYFSSCEFWKFLYCKEQSHFTWAIKFVSPRLFTVFLYYHFNVHSIGGNEISFSSDSKKLCNFSLFLGWID